EDPSAGRQARPTRRSSPPRITARPHSRQPRPLTSPAAPARVTLRRTAIPAETITLTQDQAEDLRELLSYAEIPEDGLLHAPSDILNELARFAYHDHFHPCSAARGP